jgi:hypothetical protein
MQQWKSNRSTLLRHRFEKQMRDGVAFRFVWSLEAKNRPRKRLVRGKSSEDSILYRSYAGTGTEIQSYFIRLLQIMCVCLSITPALVVRIWVYQPLLSSWWFPQLETVSSPSLLLEGYILTSSSMHRIAGTVSPCLFAPNVSVSICFWNLNGKTWNGTITWARCSSI